MRGIGRALARLPVAAVIWAGVIHLGTGANCKVLAQVTRAHVPASGAEQALAMPRVAMRPGAEVGMPQPLPATEAARLRRAFALQRAGDIAGAARVAAWLDDASPLGQAMFGHLLADRHLNPATRPSAAALRDWLARWPGLPDAAAIYRLLLTRLPDGAPPPPAVAAPPVPPPAVAEDDAAQPEGPRRNPELDRDVHTAARARGAVGVLRLLGRTPGLTADYAALLRGEAAEIAFTLNHDADARALAAGAAARSALAGLAGGLAAWREGRIATAGSLFQSGWHAPLSTPDLAAACAFWAGRARQRQGDVEGALAWMLRAAERSRTFYGMIARRRLGLRAVPHSGPEPHATIGEADVAAVAATSPGLRAFALLQVGETARAEAELRLLWPAARQGGALARAVMLVAGEAGLDEVAAQFASLLAGDGRARAWPFVPLPPLRPAGGFRIDPAMLYGIARTESNFDPRTVSSAGALGILQIMPETARDLLGGKPVAQTTLLRDPAFNLDLGQRYIVYLSELDTINGDLIRLLASYNAGPGSFARWAPEIRDGGDPLMFIEAIPIDETRAYVPRVLTNTWLYAARLHLPAPSLDELAAGMWPRYHPRGTTPTIALVR
jgi:soluble lytic murein transglycosylase